MSTKTAGAAGSPGNGATRSKLTQATTVLIEPRVAYAIRVVCAEKHITRSSFVNEVLLKDPEIRARLKEFKPAKRA